MSTLVNNTVLLNGDSLEMLKLLLDNSVDSLITDPPAGISFMGKKWDEDKGSDNTHPTVKSSALMIYLIKLITPPNGVVLDPFMGSGSTGVAALKDNFKFIGIEKELGYYNITMKRLNYKEDL